MLADRSAQARVAVLPHACLWLVLLAATAQAAPRTVVTLDYGIAPGISGCPDAGEFRAGVARQLGYDPIRPVADKHVAVQIARKEGGFDGRIRWGDAQGHWVGERRISSRHSECGEVAASLAFSVAVQVQLLAALEPVAVAEPPEATSPVPEPSPPPAPPPKLSPRPREPAVETATAAPSRAPAPRPFRLSIGVGPSVAVGVGPRTTGLGRMFASGRMGPFSLEVGGDAALPMTQQDASGRGFSMDRFAGDAAACGHARVVAACLTTSLGYLRARGFGVDQSASPAGLFSQVGARLGAIYDFGGRYFASVHLDGLLMITPFTVTINDLAVWTTPRASALGGVDIGVHLF